jgi:hypothetical protein
MRPEGEGGAVEDTEALGIQRKRWADGCAVVGDRLGTELQDKVPGKLPTGTE